MHRIRFIGAALLVGALGFVALAYGPLATAQTAIPAASATARHPLVGAWIISDPANSPSVTVAVIAFTADGIVVETEIDDDGTGIGSWTATGADTATFTFMAPITDSGQAKIATVRGTLTVTASGVSGPYSFTNVSKTGAVLASGKGQVTGARLPAATPTS